VAWPRDDAKLDRVRSLMDKAGVDAIVARAGVPASGVAAALTTLELAGLVAGVPGGRWQRMHRS